MQQIRLSAQRRDGIGKGAARELRRSGFLPAVLYGQEKEPIPLMLDAHRFRRLTTSESIENILITLEMDGQEETVMVREIQRDPISRDILHTDFVRISLTEEVNTHVPIVLEGIPLGVREEGGILEFGHRELGIRCLPTQIPQEIRISVTALAVGDSIHVFDIPLPDGFTPSDDPDTLILSIRPPTLREVEAPEAEELEVEEAEPEVISRRREEEEAVGEG